MDKNYKNIVMPEYIRHFSCIGAKCEDTCCSGWTVYIDENTYKKYKKVNQKEMKVRLSKEIVQKHTSQDPSIAAKIKLKNGRCAFLSPKGWCDIYSTLGEDYLSSTCKAYPRTLNLINRTLEYSLILSCPEAARLILLSKEPIKYIKDSDLKIEYPISAHIETNLKKPQRWQDYFLEIRSTLIQIIQNRNLILEERIKVLGQLLKEIDDQASRGSINKISLVLKDFANKDLSIQAKTAKDNLDTEIREYFDLAISLKKYIEENKIKSIRYIECLQQVFTGLSMNNLDDKKQITIEFQTAYKNYLTHFVSEYGYIIENYLVNYLFERCIPLDESKPIKSYQRIKLCYRLIKLQIIGMFSYYQEVSQEWIIKLIQSFSKTFDHDDTSLTKLLTYLQHEGTES